MAITKTVTIEPITIEANGIILYRETTKVFEDGVEIAKSHNRVSLTPGQDTTGKPANVIAICDVVWTQAVIDAYEAFIASQVP